MPSPRLQAQLTTELAALLVAVPASAPSRVTIGRQQLVHAPYGVVAGITVVNPKALLANFTLNRIAFP